MYGSGLTCYSFWWIVPVFMMILCFFMIWRRRGTMMCGFGPRNIDTYQARGSDSAREILDKRYASGEIDKEEYQERKSALAETNES